ILCSILLLARLIQAIRSTHFKRRPSTPTSKSSTRSTTCRTYILLGSGGHTGEMMRLLSELPFDRYTPRLYIISSGDKLSKTKALELEANKSKGDFSFLEIPRARRVHQSFFTTPWSTVVSLIYCLWYITLSRPYPDLVLLNGPGSSVPIALAAFLPRILHLRASPRLIYVESLARVQRLSLSGTILLPFMDVFIVQWDRL
ncbi:family 1 glycosyltransferase, partial [Melampsora larici-populina 98AG31]